MPMLKRFWPVLVVNFIIAAGFYLSQREAVITDISSDLSNILPICMKLDNPELFQNDLYLSEIDDVKYYTPAFVQSLRFFALFTSGDYVQALNLMGFVTHLLYGLLWFAFFYTLRRDFWLALLFSVFFRGVIWPPGGELLGISDIWTIMPRTAFMALAPLPLLLFCYLKRYKVAAAALALGLITNLHPITGVGVTVCYFSAYALYAGYFLREGRLFVRNFLLGVLGWIVGILPYLLTYFLNVRADAIDQALFTEAFHNRLGFEFADPMLFLQSWHRPVAYFFGLLFLVYYFFDASPRKRDFKILFFSAVVALLLANASVYVENAVNALAGINLRMSFQLIRFQKVALLLCQIGTFLLLVAIARRFAIRQSVKVSVFVAFLMACSLSTTSPFSRTPLIGDDLITSILPENLMVTDRPPFYARPERAGMIEYVKQNTPEDAVFFGTQYLRAGAARSVVLDKKGASMLIEGDRQLFIQWHLDLTQFKAMDQAGKIAFLKSKGVTHILADAPWTLLRPVHQIGGCYLYAL